MRARVGSAALSAALLGSAFLARPAVAQSADAAAFGRYGSPKQETAPPDRATPPAPEPETRRIPKAEQFGDAGQFAVLVGSKIAVGLTAPSQGESSFSVRFDPALEYFFVKNVSIGAELDVEYSSTPRFFNLHETLVGGAVHFGVNVPLGRWFSLYPLFMVGFHSIHETEQRDGASLPSALASQESTRFGPWLSAQIPVLYHPVEHFFVGVGPTVYHDFSHLDAPGNQSLEFTRIGASFVMGGYFDLRAPSEPNVAPRNDQPPAEHKELGDRGVVVITEENGFSYASVPGTKSVLAQESWSVSGGFDWFFATSQSVGLGAYFSKVSASRPFGGDYSADSVGFDVRYGYLFPLAAWLSVYPRVFVAYSTGSGIDQVLAASISVPVLFQPARHFFFGFGPGLAEDITKRASSSRTTTFGASSVLGGWL